MDAAKLDKVSRGLRRARAGAGKSQAEMASVAGVSTRCYYKWENNRFPESVRALCKIADECDVSLDELVGRDR